MLREILDRHVTEAYKAVGNGIEIWILDKSN